LITIFPSGGNTTTNTTTTTNNNNKTRSTQRAQTSAERQFFPDPDRDPERIPGSAE